MTKKKNGFVVNRILKFLEILIGIDRVIRPVSLAEKCGTSKKRIRCNKIKIFKINS